MRGEMWPAIFSPAISFFVNCKTQEQVEELWEKLTEGAEKQSCGWLKDKCGMSSGLIGRPLQLKLCPCVKEMLGHAHHGESFALFPGQLARGPLYVVVHGDALLFVRTPEPALAEEARNRAQRPRTQLTHSP
jgi:hypothetical protein